VLLTLLGLAPAAHALPGGITGRSGKQGTFCNACHSGGATPTVTLTGPTTVEAGSTNSYRLTITGGAAVVGGMNAAVDVADATLGAGTGLRLSNGEVTHSAPRAFSGGSLAFDFTLRAPPHSGPVKLYAAGNSANGNGKQDGDRGSATLLTLQVTGGTAPPPDAGTPDGGVAPTPDAGTPDGGVAPTEPPVLEDEPTGGCSAASGPAALLALLVLLGTARRRRPRG
jgi:uncharacterized protein (TIGR03382 family)